MSSSRKSDLERSLRQVFICLRPPHTPYTLYSIPKGGRELNQREGRWAPGESTEHKAGSKIPT
jgi:hypothetical protein